MAVKIKKKKDPENEWLTVHIMPVDGVVQTKFVNAAGTKEKIINRNQPPIVRVIK